MKGPGIAESQYPRVGTGHFGRRLGTRTRQRHHQLSFLPPQNQQPPPSLSTAAAHPAHQRQSCGNWSPTTAACNDGLRVVATSAYSGDPSATLLRSLRSTHQSDPASSSSTLASGVPRGARNVQRGRPEDVNDVKVLLEAPLARSQAGDCSSSVGTLGRGDV